MKSFLKELYALHIEHIETKFSTCQHKEKENEKEGNYYDILYNKLSDTDKKLFIEYIDTVGFRHCDEEELAYRHGFIDGVLLMIEIFTDK